MDFENKKKSYKYIVSGDSISKGVVFDEDRNRYVVLDENYVSLLQKELNGDIYNTSRFGNTIIKGSSRLKEDISKEQPDIVLIEFGGNDCDFVWDEVASNPFAIHNPKTDYQIFEEKLKESIEFLNEKQIKPVLMTLPPLNADKYLKWISNNNKDKENNILKWLGSVTKIYWWHERYNSSIIKVAKATNTIWIDIRGAFLEHPNFNNFICIDGIHPNQDGHKIIANKILDFIKSSYNYLLKDKK